MQNNQLRQELNEKPYIRTSLIVLLIMTAVFVVWGVFAPLKSVVVASGKIIVFGQNKVVQHLYGGIVDEILVKDGDEVKNGQILMKLDDIQAKSNYTVLLKNKYETLAQMSMLSSIIDNKKQIEFDNELKQVEDKEYLDKIMNSQKNIFISKKHIIKTQNDIFKKKIESIKGEIDGIKESLKTKDEYMKSLEEEINEWSELYKEKLVSKVNLRDIQRKKMSLQTDITQYKANLSKLNIQILELEEQMLLENREFLNDSISKLNDQRTKLSEIDEKLLASKDIVDKSIIKSPSAGIIQDISVFTKGGVIQPASAIMNIVPKNKSLIIEAKLNTTDIDQVRQGMKCDIMFLAFDTQNTFVVEGIVDYVSADSTLDRNTNQEFYTVNISFTKNGKQQIKDNKFVLQTGMPTDVMIQTGSRTLLSYIIQPFKDISRRAFNED
jgi:epimerase transport system membrane fusion protein